jgi:hypothetical protein
VENHVCLSHVVQLTGAACWAATRIMVGVEDLVQKTRNISTGQVLGDQMIGRSGDVICGLYRAHGDDEHMFLG